MGVKRLSVLDDAVTPTPGSSPGQALTLPHRGGGWCFLGFLIIAALFAQPLCAEVPVPPLKARVTDLTATLNAKQREALEQKLAAFEARKGSQVAVLLVPTTQPEAIEQYSIRVAQQWKLGRKGVDDGVLLLVAKNDRKLRIEVGYGLEGVLNDATAKRIIAEDIVPRFKQGDFYGGITAGVDRILRTIEREPLPAPKSKPQQRGAGFEEIEYLLVIGFVLVFVVGSFVRALLGRFVGSGVVGATAGAIAWLIASIAIVGVVVGLLAFILSLFGGVAGRRGGWSTGGWSSGGDFSGGSAGGDGGFSGGGGDFGGGGASSGW